MLINNNNKRDRRDVISVNVQGTDIESLNSIKVIWYPQMDQKVCLNMVKKDQLCAIALKKRN